MKFWGRSGSQSQPAASIKRNGSSDSLTSSLNTSINDAPSRKTSTEPKPSSQNSWTSLPTRKQRMLLLKCIIHHADAVQKQYLVPKQLSSSTPKTNSTIDNVSNIFIRTDKATAEINDKCYQRWHQVLQEGLVPMSVHALNLLERRTTITGESDEILYDEEDDYFATIADMDEEIQVMALLARAAALDNLPVSYGGEGCSNININSTENSDGMEQIKDMMKCTAMLLFHIVLAASTPGSSPSGSHGENNSDETKNNAAKATEAGYDGRVRHVAKLACVDVLTHAILESAEAFDNSNKNTTTDERYQAPDAYDMDKSSGWNIANIKFFLDRTDLGKDAVFGTPYNSENSGEKTLLQAREEIKTQMKREIRQSQPETHQIGISGNISKQSKSKGKVPTPGEYSPQTVDPMGSNHSYSNSSSSLEVHSEITIDCSENKSLEGEHDDDRKDNPSNRSQGEHLDEEQDFKTKVDLLRDFNYRNRAQQRSADEIFDTNEVEQIAKHAERDQEPDSVSHEQQHKFAKELHARRQFNAKFLATRKFELIERLVAIDIVRFFIAEEREKKLRERESNAQKGNKLPSLFKNDSSEVQGSHNKGAANDGEPNNDENVVASSEQITNKSSQIFTANRVRQIQRGAKIAGCGLALGTVFAITGGLAAPALAAGIGGIAALTGASTASSAALLAVLATFKAGAALFGVGGGGLAAYKMKKRTAGLSQFEIRRENIEQFMYPGASEEKLKKGIESMLPQLHTTIVVSGWLRHNDIADFQLAWGIQPTCNYGDQCDDRRRIRQMKRFYTIYNPPLVYLCESFMKTLQKRLKNDFSWDRIWNSLEQKYGANPDHMIPIDTPHENEVFLSHEEKYMIGEVLNNAKSVNLKKKFGHDDGIDFNGDDEISELLSKVSPEKVRRENTIGSETELDLDEMEHQMEHELITMQNGQSDLPLDVSDCSVRTDDHLDSSKRGTLVKEIEMSILSVTSSDDGGHTTPETSPTSQGRMEKQREHHVSIPKEECVIDDEANLQEDPGSPKMADSDSGQNLDPPQNENHPAESEETIPQEYEDGSSPVVWDWKRLYGAADIHTVTWESDMLSSLCHIVENMALEVSTQATKVALQYSVIGAIVSAVAIPSALVTASKLIDDPYQIVVIRADEAGKELAKCLLMSDERRPVTLVGFSFGARVVYSCLRELARQQDIWEKSRTSKPEGSSNSLSSFLSKKSKDERRFEYDREPASLVGDVIFIGLPRAIDKSVLTSCRRVTGGRLVNCYTTNDWLLSLMFVARGGTPCGTKPIKDVAGVDNYDVTHLVESHTKYGDAIPNILQLVRFSEP